MSAGRSVAAAVAVALSGCRGQPSEDPPFHLVHDMRTQNKVRPEAASAFFADGRGMRPKVPGTLAQGELVEDEVFLRGRTSAGFAQRAPVQVSEATLRRGQERFDIYCSACHDRAGSGRGINVQRGFPPPVDLTSDRVRGFADGEIFQVISTGVRNMPAYAAQIPESDRWAIVTWVRVLQRSQRATLQDVPSALRERIEPEAK